VSGLWLWVRSEWRRGWAGLLALGLLIAMSGGVTLAVAAGARRADSAIDRFAEVTNQPQVEIELASFDDLGGAESVLASLPSASELADTVERVGGVEGLTVLNWIAATPDPRGEFFNGGIGTQRGRAPTPLLLDGRWPDPTDPHEAVVGEAAMDEWRLELGATVPLHSLGPTQLGRWIGVEGGEAAGPVVDVRVVGVIRDIEEITDAPEPFLLVNQAFVDEYEGEVLSVPGIVSVTAVPGSVDRVVEDLQEAVGAAYTVGVEAEDFAGRIDEAVSVEVDALWVFALAAAAAGLVVVYQAMSRHAADEAGDRFVLRMLGSTRRNQVVGSAVRLAPALLAGALGAAGLAVSLSPLFPRGLARRAEPSPGFRVDGPVLVVGVVAIVVLGAIAAAVVGRGRRRDARLGGVAPPAPLDRLAASMSPAGGLGLRFALAPRGRMAHAGWAGITGAALAVAGLLMVAVVDRSVDRLMHTPRLYGAGWDAVLDLEPGRDAEPIVAAASELPEVAAVGVKEVLPGEPGVQASGPGGSGVVEPEVYRSLAGALAPTLTGGRLPAGPGEVAIGDGVARSLGAGTGDPIEVEGADGPRRFVVVGRVVTPGTDELAGGFVVTHEGLVGLTAACPATEEDPLCTPSVPGIGVLFAEGADPVEALARLRAIDEGFVPVELPSVVHNLGQIGSTPWYLAAFLCLLGVAGVAHAMTIGAERRDRDLAVTRAVGLRPGQAAGSIRWQGLVLAAVGGLAGVLLGVVGGRVVWRGVAEGTGAIVETVVPVWAMLAAPAAAVAVGLLLAMVPARRASTRRMAELLRTE
jgi:ABC-type lipoprotein release transport system permease subunit